MSRNSIHAMVRHCANSPAVNPRFAIETSPEAILLSGMIFVTAMLLQACIGFFLNIPIKGIYLYSSVFITLIADLSIGAYGKKIPLALYAFLATTLAIWVAVFLSSKTFDESYDGMAYQQVSIIAMHLGWNPVYSAHLSDWWSATFPNRAWLSRTLADDGLWSDHYPMASWVLGSIVSSATGSLNASKWLGIFLAFMACFAIFRGLRIIGAPALATAVIAISTTMSPVVVAQFGTNYVDGSLGSALTIQVGAFLSWASKRKRTDLLVLIFSIILASNFKFTGALYSLAMATLALLLGFTTEKKLDGTDIKLIAFGAVCLGIISFHPYADNLLAYGHPLYPMNVTNVMHGQIDQVFLDRDRITKFIISSFNAVSSPTVAPLGPHLVLPRLWHYRILSTPDIRINGFGSLFIYSLGAALVCLLFCLTYIKSNSASASRANLIWYAIGWIFITVVINPEFWWARYVPQLWLIPPLAASLAFIEHRRWIGILTISMSLIGAALTTIYVVSVT